VVLRQQTAAQVGAGHHGSRPDPAGLVAEPDGLGRRRADRGVPRGPARGPGPAGHAGRGPGWPRHGRGGGGHDSAAGADHRAAAAPAEQLHPRVAVAGRHRGCQRSPDNRLRRHAAPAGQRQLDRCRPVGGLPLLRPVPGRQQRSAVPAAGLQRVGRHRPVPQLLRVPSLALPPRPNALRDGRGAGHPAVVPVHVRLRLDHRGAGVHHVLGGAALAQRPVPAPGQGQ
jgi:hypothetical protein